MYIKTCHFLSLSSSLAPKQKKTKNPQTSRTQSDVQSSSISFFIHKIHLVTSGWPLKSPSRRHLLHSFFCFGKKKKKKDESLWLKVASFFFFIFFFFKMALISPSKSDIDLPIRLVSSAGFFIDTVRELRRIRSSFNRVFVFQTRHCVAECIRYTLVAHLYPEPIPPPRILTKKNTCVRQKKDYQAWECLKKRRFCV